jgi:transcriptional regulator with XRE-family HTH domain
MRDSLILGGTIRKLREARGLRNVDLAYQVPIARAYLSEIESGNKTPSFAMVNDIARGLNMKPSDLWRAVAESIDEQL